MRHLVESGLALLATASLPLQFWLYAFHIATYLINRLPTKVLQFQSPFQVLFNKIQNYHHLKVFGYLCYPYLRSHNKHKLCYRSSPCVFLGYSPTHKGYMCFDSNSNSIYITRPVKFHETKFPFQQTVNTSSASSSSQFTSTPALLPIPLSIPPTQTSQSSVPTSQSPHLSNSAHSYHSSHNSTSLLPILDPILVPFTASSSSSLTNPLAPHNSHPMTLRHIIISFHIH